MWNIRYLLIAVACVAMSLSSCECQKSSPPGVGEEPKADFNAPKPPALADAAKTPEEKPKPPEDLSVKEPPPLPEDFPKDIPVFEDSKVAQVQDLANNAHNVIFVSDKPLATITSFYRKKLEDGGWKLTQNSERGNHAFVAFKRGNMIANIQVAEDPRYPGKRLIAIMYEQEKPLPFDEF